MLNALASKLLLPSMPLLLEPHGRVFLVFFSFFLPLKGYFVRFGPSATPSCLSGQIIPRIPFWLPPRSQPSSFSF